MKLYTQDMAELCKNCPHYQQNKCGKCQECLHGQDNEGNYIRLSALPEGCKITRFTLLKLQTKNKIAEIKLQKLKNSYRS